MKDNEVRLIDAELLTTNIAQIAKVCAKSDAQKALVGRILFMIDNMSTIEAKPIKPMLDLIEHIQMMLCTIYDTGSCIQPRDMECLTKNADKLRELIKESGCGYDKP